MLVMSIFTGEMRMTEPLKATNLFI